MPPVRKPQVRSVKGKRGRPTKKTDAVVAVILRALENGATRKAAAHIALVAPSTLYQWAETDPQFSLLLEQAQARFIEKVGLATMLSPSAALKWAMMLARDDPQLQPVEDKVAVTQTGKSELVIRVVRDLGDPKRPFAEPDPEAG